MLVASCPTLLLASGRPVTANTDLLVDVFQNLEEEQRILKEPKIGENVRETIRILIIPRQANLALITGHRAEFEDQIIRLVNRTNTNDSANPLDEFVHKSTSIISMSIELGWPLEDEKVKSFFDVASLLSFKISSDCRNRNAFEFARGNVVELRQILNDLPEIKERSNSWRFFISGMANLRYCKLAGSESHLLQAVQFFKTTPKVTSTPYSIDENMALR